MIPKYRAWHKKEKKMYSVWHIDYLLKQIGLKELLKTREAIVKFNKIVLMQSTGLKDKNGKEIFEGDIVAHADIGGVIERDNSGSFIIRHKGGTGTTLFFDNRNELIVIIGNIHENPELLKKETK